VCDWEGAAIPVGTSDATRVARLFDEVLATGCRIVVIASANVESVVGRLGHQLKPENARRLFVSANRGSEMFGFDRKGTAVPVWRRAASPEEEASLDRIASEVEATLVRKTGLAFRVVRDRLNRREIDLIPEPAWGDPPKSKLGELLGAVEARLQGAGMRGGLREAFETTARIAHEHGLPSARITSDVKYIVIGLTDKSDAIKYVLEHVVQPLGVPARDILVVGDQFGPLGSLDSGDYRMRSLPGVFGAVVVSVGPEPGGSPPGVIHLGGGPERFWELLEEQLRAAERLGPFAPPRDAAWIVEETGFDVAREHELESLLTVANGYVGTRGSLPEGTSVSRPATFLAGAFVPSNDPSHVPELLVLPEWSRLRFAVAGEDVSVERGEILHHRRILDLRRAVLLRETEVRGRAGHVTHLRALRAASLAEPHNLIEAAELTPQNFTGNVSIEALLTGDARGASGAPHWAGFVASVEGAFVTLHGRTKTDVTVVMTSRVEWPNGAGTKCERAAVGTEASERCEVLTKVGEPSRVFRTVSIHSSHDLVDPASGSDVRAATHAKPFLELLRDHEAAWAERWRRADVEIDGAPHVDRALRFGLYHLISAASPNNPRCSLGARGLSGDGYRGHVFWDTAIFAIPFYTYCYPETARSELEYRYRHLDAAQRKARAHGFSGALFPWESAATGEECTPAFVVSPLGRLVRVLCGEQEQHISADVAYATWHYARITGDQAFASGPGLELLVETARFWASRVEYAADGLAHIRRVIGPDEYHETVDDDAFTNWMARFNLRAAANEVERWRRSGSTAARETLARLSLGEQEPARWLRVGDDMYLGQDAKSGLIEQCAGFFGFEFIDLADYARRTVPVDMLLGHERTQRAQVVKQADVVQLLALLWDEVAPDARRANFLYYEPRTSHGSSLSPGVHALVAARLGLDDAALRYLSQTSDIDLSDNMGNATGGVHVAAMGSLWQAIVFGVAGVRHAPDRDDVLIVEPHMLRGFRHLGFPLSFRGCQLDVQMDANSVEIAMEGAHPLDLRIGQLSTRVEPGRRVAARLDSEGGRRWLSS
jgi:kojibiose phosphorylase